MQDTASSGRSTQGSFFEGLFILSLRASGAFADELRACGFDPGSPRAIYPIEVWNATLEVAWRHCYPTLERELAYRELGRQLALGFLRTWRGKVVDMGLPVLGPDRVLERLPGIFAIDTFRYELKVLRVEPRHYRITFREDPDAKPDLVAGVIEEGLRRTGVKPQVVVSMRAPRDFDLDVNW